MGKLIFALCFCLTGCVSPAQAAESAPDYLVRNPIFIVLWTSSSPITNDKGDIIAIEWTDRQSFRRTSYEAEEWVKALKAHGRGFNFAIYEAYPYKYFGDLDPDAQEREQRSNPYKTKGE